MNFFKDFVEVLPMPCVLVNQDVKIQHMNLVAQQLMDLDFEGRPFVTVFRQPDLLGAVEDVLRNGKAQDVEFSLFDNQQNSRYIVNCKPMVLNGQNHAVLFFNNVTQAERVEQMRKDFVANVSHELRTPLTALLGFIETLQTHGRNDPKAQERFLKLMAIEASHMEKLIKDLLSLSHVESEERRSLRGTVNLVELWPTVHERFMSLAQDQSCTIEFTHDVNDAVVHGQWDQLIQLLSNLVENALKYGGAGGRVVVSIKEAQHHIGLGCHAYCLSVQDFGAGIAQEHLPRLTERFYRVDGHRARAMGGTGLGLAIVKHIVTRHHGRLYIQSSQGEGSEFSVYLPMVVS